MDTFIKNIEARGLCCQVVSIANTPDSFITSHSSFKLASNNYEVPKEMKNVWMERFVEIGKKPHPMMFISTAEIADAISNDGNNDDA